MEYITSPADSVYLYRCSEHGEWELGPRGLHPPLSETFRDLLEALPADWLSQ